MSTILIVDDDVDIRRLLRQVLSAEGRDIIEARDGAEALRSINEQEPELVLLDMMMPVLDGWGVLAAVDRATAPTIVVITALATARDHHVIGVLERGALEVIAKPFDPEWLVRLVEAVLASEPEERVEYRRRRLAHARLTPEEHR